MAAPSRLSVISKGRIESLSDLIFGLALSIGSIVLIGIHPSDPGSVLVSVGEFALGFLILISVWRPYTEIMAHVDVETTSALDLNIALMLLVALEPYLFNLLWSASGNTQEFASQLYSLDLAGLMFILSSLLELLIRRMRSLHREASATVLTYSRVRLALVGGIFLVSALRIFSVDLLGALTAREVLWGFATALNLGSRERTREALRSFHRSLGPSAESSAGPEPPAAHVQRP